MKIDVSTKVEPDGSVACHIDVGGRRAAVTFAEGEITLAVPSPGGEISFSVPESLASGRARP